MTTATHIEQIPAIDRHEAAAIAATEYQRFVDEYNTRFAPDQELDAPPPVRIRRRRFALTPWLLALGLLAASTALLAWRLSSSGGRHATVQPPPARTRPTRPVASPAPHTTKQTATVSRIVLVASRGPCWLSVHIRSATGQTVFERTLQPSQTARFTVTRRHLWMRIGAPWNLDATLNGKTVQLSATTGNVLVTPAGLSTTTS